MNVCFAGCSFTWGEGFDNPVERERYVYDRLVSEKFEFSSNNIAQIGYSNYKIFLSAADAIMSGKYQIVFAQWSGLRRIWLHPGPDAYYTITPGDSREQPDYVYRDIFISKKDRKKIHDTITILNHDYQNLLDLIKYCNILEKLAANNCNTEVYFINGLVPWQQDLFTNLGSDLGSDLGSSLSNFTKEMLDFDTRSDDELIKFVLDLQTATSTLNQSLWVNITESFHANSTDVGPVGHHPGIESNQWMADKIINFLEDKI